MNPVADISTVVAGVLKFFVLFGLSLYAIFAVVMVRQEHLMAHVLEEFFEPVLRVLVYIHLVAAVSIVLLAFVLL
jgi:hypothetical protein